MRSKNLARELVCNLDLLALRTSIVSEAHVVSWPGLTSGQLMGKTLDAVESTSLVWMYVVKHGKQYACLSVLGPI